MRPGAFARGEERVAVAQSATTQGGGARRSTPVAADVVDELAPTAALAAHGVPALSAARAVRRCAHRTGGERRARVVVDHARDERPARRDVGDERWCGRWNEAGCYGEGMTPIAPATDRDTDQRVYLHGVSWDDYERLLDMRGESSGVRITFLEGEVELMSPSRSHERIKKTLARLVEAYAEERGLALNGCGSWTIKERREDRGAEPDECYVLGVHEPERPDLAIEVVWTSGGLDKLEVYRGLGVREVWTWIDGRIVVHELEGERYVERARSALLPGLDLARVASLAARPDQTQAGRELRQELRGG